MFKFTVTSAVVVVGLITACSDSPGATAPGQPINTLPPGSWVLSQANNEDLPAPISLRLVGLVEERTLLDSARLAISQNGSYEQFIYLSIEHNGVRDRSELIYDRGSWGPPSSASYVFSSSLRPRAFSLVPRSTTIESSEPVLSYVGAPLVSGVYRLGTP
jgi:hypothetical protein